MREAVGGSLLLYIIIPIIILFIVFIGFVMRYASTYRAANYVVTQIENCQGKMDNCGDIDMEGITATIKSDYGYITPNVAPNIGGVVTPICISNNKEDGRTGVVYRVELPVEFDLPFFGSIRWMVVKVETKTIQDATC